MQNSSRVPRYPLSSVGNALKLLLMFGGNKRVRLSEASKHLGVAHSTAHRLLAMLAYHGLIQQVGASRVYVAGPALIEVGLAAVRDMDVRSHARPLLAELAEQFHETAHLTVLEGANVRFLDSVEGQQAVRVVTRVGTVMPAHCTSVGKALLAAHTPEQLDALLGRGELPPRTSRSITSRQQLDEELDRVRARGFATSNGESEDAVASVGVAVQGQRGMPVAALSLAAPAHRMSPQRRMEFAEALIKAAERLSAGLSLSH